MKRFAKLGAVVLAAAMALGTMAFAPAQFIPAEISENESDYNWGNAPSFISFSGSVAYMEETAFGMRIRVRHEQGSEMDFMVNHLTHFMGDDIEVDSLVTGFYDAHGIAPMIYPPQHTMRLITVNMETSVVLDRFEALESFDGSQNQFLSHSNQLILNINENTPIYLQDGQNVRTLVATGESSHETVADFINNRKLVVTYSLANFMMPAGTIPADPTLTVTVLFEQAVALPDMGLSLGLDTGYDADNDDPIDWQYNYGITVNGRFVDALWQEVDGGFYVPFRAVVNLLGFGATVGWDDETRSVTVYNGTNVIYTSIGSSEFRIGNETVTLQHPAIIINDRTYVPFQFFSQVFGMNNAWMSGGQIFIDNEEIMN